MPEKLVVPKFKSEAAEAAWWAKSQDLIAANFEKAAVSGRLGRGTAARLARQRASAASPTITIRLPQNDLTRARAQAAKRGLRYQTYLKMLLHEALDRQERSRR